MRKEFVEIFHEKEYAKLYDNLDNKYDNLYSSGAKGLIKLANFDKNNKILEIGSGTGFSTKELIDIVGEENVIATEYGESMFNILKEKYKNSYRLDALYLNKFIKENNINNIDIIFSNYTYYYLYKFEDILFETIYATLNKGGKYCFNITNFLQNFTLYGLNYNNFYINIINGFNEFLLKEGIKEGVGEIKNVIDYSNTVNKLKKIGFEVIIDVEKINLLPSQMLDFMIDNFYKFGSFISWSSTLDNNKDKINLLKNGKEYIKNSIDFEYPHIINIIAKK